MSDITTSVSTLVASIAAAASRTRVNKRTCNYLAIECKWVFERLLSGELGSPTDPGLKALVASLELCRTDLVKFTGSGFFVRWLRAGDIADICAVHAKSLDRWLSRVPQRMSDEDSDSDVRETRRLEQEIDKNLYNAGRILASDIPSKIQELAIINPDHLVVGEEKGTFQFGVIYAGEYNQKPVLVRRISDDFDGAVLDLFNSGILLSRCLSDCNNILPVHGICQGRMIVTGATAHGQLSKFSITETLQKVVIARKVADALMFMHDIAAPKGGLRVVHRDIRAANILIDSGPGGLEPKITGFEMCKEDGKISGVYPVSDERIERWWSPERIRGSGTSPKSDVYAFGVLMYEISTGKEPEADIDLLKEEGRRICIEYTKLMEKCLHPRYNSRPNMDDVVNELLSIENSIEN
ncbi:hypothetical protein BGZ99_006852 [Dissophora globulifera]|uniref:Protein kinase domain-containing protein n=1 Tax=Dissophora globulifera TaxID=979702 RepID=A0A9P6URJ5_9FUNG|nr:hypothetical protein BGZ99_006852 [Dissophora globulifera]